MKMFMLLNINEKHHLKKMFVGSTLCVITFTSNSICYEEVTTHTLHVFPLANIHVEEACEQATHYCNSGSQIVKILDPDITTLQNV